MTREQRRQIITILNLHAVNEGNASLAKELVLEMEKLSLPEYSDMNDRIKSVSKTIKDHAKESAENLNRK